MTVSTLVQIQSLTSHTKILVWKEFKTPSSEGVFSWPINIFVMMHEFNLENATWFTLYTLIDISHSIRRKDVSQKNWDTIINGISMRAQPLGSNLPEKKRQKTTKFKFGSEYKNKVINIWTWSFAIEHVGAVNIKILMDEFHGMPVIDNLKHIETKGLKIKNTYFVIANS